jgi:uncharacterized membrane protein YjjP (DUF1212 family)
MSRKRISKKELLRAIKQIEKNPNDRVKILGEIGIAGIGVVAGGASAAILGAGTASIPVITALTGLGLAVAAPVTLVAGAAVAGGLATYGVAKLVSGGAAQEAKRCEIKKRLEEQLREIEAEEQKAKLTTSNKNAFIIFLRTPLEQNLITAEQAQQLIEFVEGGQMSLEEAYQLLDNLLDENKNNGSVAITKA